MTLILLGGVLALQLLLLALLLLRRSNSVKPELDRLAERSEYGFEAGRRELNEEPVDNRTGTQCSEIHSDSRGAGGVVRAGVRPVFVASAARSPCPRGREASRGVLELPSAA